MLNQALFDKLIQLRLPAFRTGLLEQQTNSKYAELSFEERLAILVDLECTRRHSNRIQRLVKAAEFPLPAAVEDLDLAPTRGLERPLVLELAQSAWVQNHFNLLVLGPTGSGKTYVACALAMSACRARFSVRYFRTSRLLHRLTLARQDNSYHTLLHSLAKIDLIILDDWMRDAIAVPHAQDLLELLDDRFGRSSTIVASQVPIQEWHSRIPDPTLADAVLDRLIHNAHRLNLEGESQRKLRAIRSMPTTDSIILSRDRQDINQLEYKRRVSRWMTDLLAFSWGNVIIILMDYNNSVTEYLKRQTNPYRFVIQRNVHLT